LFVTLTLTSDRVILYTVVHHSSTSTYMPNFIEIEEIFCWQTDVCTDGQTFEIHFMRSTQNSRPKNQSVCVSECWETVPWDGGMSSTKIASPVAHCAAQQWCSGWPTESADETGSVMSYTWVPERTSRLLSDNESRYVATDAGTLPTPFYNDHNVITRNWTSNRYAGLQGQMYINTCRSYVNVHMSCDFTNGAYTAPHCIHGAKFGWNRCTCFQLSILHKF